jgi:hypothetical protein
MIRFLGLACVAALFALVSVVQADNHHNGHSLIGDKLKTNGKHVLHTHGDHTAHAHVTGGKIAKVEVNHKTKGAVKVTAYTSNKKLHADAGSRVEHHYVSLDPEAAEPQFGGAIAWVGWGYTVNGVVIIYWFPVTIVVGIPAGAVVYAP